MKIFIYNEGLHDKTDEIKAVYPNGIHGKLAEILRSDGHEVVVATLDNVSEVFTQEALKDADVIFWWGHVCHDAVPDEVADIVHKAVLSGTGFVALHSAHLSKPFVRLMGTTCTLAWREGDRERIWTSIGEHPITEGVPASFELENEEMYGEYFDVPTPDEIIFIGWFAGGEVFRSGCTWRRGCGKVFYFQPGHEEYPTYYNENIQKILKNAARWAGKTAKSRNLSCIHQVPSPECK